MAAPGPDWPPAAELRVAQARAELLTLVRRFFAERQVLEVETPVLGRHGALDPYIDSLSVSPPQGGYLQTSPEYHMKRLLAAGYGPIYQVFRAFRAGEAGKRHNPEFTLLEWYRPDFSLDQLMQEVSDLVVAVLGCEPPVSCRYRDLMYARTGLDPMRVPTSDLQQAAAAASGLAAESLRREEALDVIMSHVVEPGLVGQGALFVVDYPPGQAALSRIQVRDGVEVARRFELYVEGMELANGYLELRDADEQAGRFAADNQLRKSLGKERLTPDPLLLDALDHGLPECTGVALGLDRLLMCQLDLGDIRQVLTFPRERA
ncbi:MAG: EF-P lysine aminoacylase GenX [Halomonadaceae bacterium]|nr:MAG: EF-P lysine aminoacylase GenX [Halomonadaceae bacterium]